MLIEVEKRKVIGVRGRKLTLNDFRTSATRNAASMISNCSDSCGWVGWRVGGGIEGNQSLRMVEDEGEGGGSEVVVVKERL